MSKIGDCYFRASRPKLRQISARVPRPEPWLSAIIGSASPGCREWSTGSPGDTSPQADFAICFHIDFAKGFHLHTVPRGWSDLPLATNHRPLGTMRGSSGNPAWLFRIPPTSRAARFPRVTDWWSAWAISAPIVYTQSSIREVWSPVCNIRNPRVRSAARMGKTLSPIFHRFFVDFSSPLRLRSVFIQGSSLQVISLRFRDFVISRFLVCEREINPSRRPLLLGRRESLQVISSRFRNFAISRFWDFKISWFRVW